MCLPSTAADRIITCRLRVSSVVPESGIRAWRAPLQLPCPALLAQAPDGASAARMGDEGRPHPDAGGPGIHAQAAGAVIVQAAGRRKPYAASAKPRPEGWEGAKARTWESAKVEKARRSRPLVTFSHWHLFAGRVRPSGKDESTAFCEPHRFCHAPQGAVLRRLPYTRGARTNRIRDLRRWSITMEWTGLERSSSWSQEH